MRAYNNQFIQTAIFVLGILTSSLCFADRGGFNHAGGGVNNPGLNNHVGGFNNPGLNNHVGGFNNPGINNHPNYYQHNNDYYHQNDNTVVVGAPIEGYYNNSTQYTCPLVQQCYPNGDCVQTQVCDDNQ